MVVADALGVHQATVPDSCLMFSMGHCLGIDKKDARWDSFISKRQESLYTQAEMPAMFERLCNVLGQEEISRVVKIRWLLWVQLYLATCGARLMICSFEANVLARYAAIDVSDAFFRKARKELTSVKYNQLVQVRHEH